MVDMNGDDLDDMVRASSTKHHPVPDPAVVSSLANIPTTPADHSPSWSIVAGDIDGQRIHGPDVWWSTRRHVHDGERDRNRIHQGCPLSTFSASVRTWWTSTQMGIWMPSLAMIPMRMFVSSMMELET